VQRLHSLRQLRKKVFVCLHYNEAFFGVVDFALPQKTRRNWADDVSARNQLLCQELIFSASALSAVVTKTIIKSVAKRITDGLFFD
jgi:hypothetical protein